MQTYLDLVKHVLEHGVHESNRTGIPTRSVLGMMFQHSMEEGFPLLTTKKVSLHSVAVELEFFIGGHTDKKWLQERGCSIWDEWCNPKHVMHMTDPTERKNQQLIETDLGPIYGKQWRHFSAAPTQGISSPAGLDPRGAPIGDTAPPTSTQPTKLTKPTNGEDSAAPHPFQDQLTTLIEGIKTDPTSRRLLVSAWNPLVLEEMALPPCHVLFQVNVIAGALSLTWFQRSCDLMLGIPYNIASYALLLHLLAKETGYREGLLTGMFSHVHIYENHLDGAREQISRPPHPLPQIETPEFTSIFDWEHGHSQIKNYHAHPRIPFSVAV